MLSGLFRRFFGASLVVLLSTVSACSDDHPTPGTPFRAYDEGNVTVIGGSVSGLRGDRITVSAPLEEGDCVKVSDSLCVTLDREGDWCEREGGPVDIVLVQGEVAKVVCYPPADGENERRRLVVSKESGSIELLRSANHTAVTFDPATNSEPLVGGIRVEGNGVSIYGNGPESTIIDGDVTLEGNNVRLRGVTITGNLYIGRNNVAVVLCSVLGDLVFAEKSANNSLLVENVVYGGFRVPSNNNLVVGNYVSGEWSVSGHNDVCDANYRPNDHDAEVGNESLPGEPLACP